MTARTFSVSAALLAAATASPALADQHMLPPLPEPDMQTTGDDYYFEQERSADADMYAAREAWLSECRSRYGDNGVGGAVIGGVVGGIAGNRIAGDGNRVIGTVAGAAVGAAAGAVVDRAEDAGRVRDYCEAYLDDYTRRYAAGVQAHHAYATPAYGYGYGQAVMMVPVRMTRHVPCPPEEVVEEVIEEWTDEVVSYAPAPRRVVATKRVPVRQVKGDKRVRYAK